MTNTTVTAAAELQGLVDANRVTVVEVPVGHKHHDEFLGWSALVHGRRVMAFPEGQDPAQRLTIARSMLAHTLRGAA